MPEQGLSNFYNASARRHLKESCQAAAMALLAGALTTILYSDMPSSVSADPQFTKQAVSEQLEPQISGKNGIFEVTVDLEKARQEAIKNQKIPRYIGIAFISLVGLTTLALGAGAVSEGTDAREYFKAAKAERDGPSPA